MTENNGINDNRSEHPILKNISHFALLASSLLVFISVLYNLAYFQIIAPEYFSLLTINDHLNSALGWLSYTPIAILPTLVFQYALSIQQAIMDTVLDISQKLIRKKKNFRRLLRRGISKKQVGRIVKIAEILPMACVAGFFGYFLPKATSYISDLLKDLGFGNNLHDYLKLLVVIIFYGIVFAYNSNKLNHWFIRFAAICSIILIPIYTGKLEAELVLSPSYKETAGELYKLETSSEKREHVIVMRSLEKGLVFRDTNTSTVSFITWDKIQNLSSYPEMDGAFCPSLIKKYSILCGDDINSDI